MCHAHCAAVANALLLRQVACPHAVARRPPRCAVMCLHPRLQSLPLMHDHYFRQKAGGQGGCSTRRPPRRSQRGPFVVRPSPPELRHLWFNTNGVHACSERATRSPRPSHLTSPELPAAPPPPPLVAPPHSGLSDRLRRITKEVASLAGQLPLSWESTVAAAMDEDRMDVLR